MTWLVSIDPGLVCTGWALWQVVSAAPYGRLWSCGLSVRPKALARAPLAEVASYHAVTVRNAAMSVPPNYVVVEQQTMSRGRDARAPIAKGNDLLAVQAVGMRVAGHVGGTLIYPTVTDWLANTQAPVTKNRVDAQLDEWGETSKLVEGFGSHPKGLHHNLYDAVALGLWATNRYRSGHAIPPRLALCA